MKKDWGKWVNAVIAVIMLGTLVYNYLSASDRATISNIEKQVCTNTSEIKELQKADTRIIQMIYDRQEKIMNLLLEMKQERRSRER